jgi:hypothetical protein
MRKQTTNKQKGKKMKLNIKGLVFMGFAAAVFASAAHATDPAPEKQVTSKAYVDAKYVGSGAVSVTAQTTGDNAGKNEISVATFTGATANGDGSAGLVKKPLSADRDKFLKGDGNWTEIDGTAYTGTAPIVVNDHAISASVMNANNGRTSGIVPSSTAADAGKVLTSEGTWLGSFSAETVAEAGDGVDGLVPAPSAANTDKFLKGDGTWATPTDNNTTYSVDDVTVQFDATNTTQIKAKTGAISNGGTSLVTSGTVYTALLDKQNIQIGAAQVNNANSTDMGKVLVVDDEGKISMSDNVLPAIPSMPDDCKDANAHCALITSYNASTQVVSMEWVPTAQAPAQSGNGE